MSPITLGHRGSAEVGRVGGEVWAHPPTGLAGTDLPMLNEFIADLREHDIGRLHNGGDTPYVLDDELVIRKRVTIQGCGAWGDYESQAVFPSIDGPHDSPYIWGSVLMQVTGGKRIVYCPEAAHVPNLLDLGGRFDDAIKFANTHHGFDVAADAPYLTMGNVGMIGGRWRDLLVYGTDGNHNAIRWLNCMNSVLDCPKAWGGGGVLLEGNAAAGGWNYGCNTVIQPWVQFYVRGTAHAIAVKENRANAMGQNVWIRPLVLAVDRSAGGGPTAPDPLTQYTLQFNEGGISAAYVIIGWPDLESPTLHCPVDFGTNPRSYVEQSGITGPDAASSRHRIAANIETQSVGLHWDNDFIRRGQSPIPAVAASAAAGSTGTASLGTNTSDDYSGILTITPGGTGIANALNSQVAVFTPFLANNLKAMTLRPVNGAAALAGDLFAQVSAGTFLIRCQGNGTGSLASGTAHQWAYVGIPK